MSVSKGAPTPTRTNIHVVRRKKALRRPWWEVIEDSVWWEEDKVLGKYPTKKAALVAAELMRALAR
jgi:hypothetical protein